MGYSVKGMTQLRARLNGLNKGRAKIARQWALKTTRLAKEKHRPNKKTGVTMASIAPRHVSERGAEVKAGGAAIFLEKGTRPHVIVPRNKKVLRFAPAGSRRLSGAPRKGAKMIFTKRVNHPGTKAYPFLGPAAREALDVVGVKVIVDEWNSAA